MDFRLVPLSVNQRPLKENRAESEASDEDSKPSQRSFSPLLPFPLPAQAVPATAIP
jgi:hypothetical protein